MFRRILDHAEDANDKLFRLHPSQLMLYLEDTWEKRCQSQSGKYPAAYQNRLPGLPDRWIDTLRESVKFDIGTKGCEWDHLIFAYMIENTRIYEVFKRVTYEYVHGEKLGLPPNDVQCWLRNTEELFYRDALPCSVMSLTSSIRPDLRASRRNAYYRMFGMDLNHGTDDNKPYPYPKADAANNEFVPTFEELLREVWVGIANVNNDSGSNPTNPGKISNLAENLYNTLNTRREYGNLSREEFVFVAMMSWFYLTIEFNSPVVVDLNAEAASPEQRLFKIAQYVGLPAHALSRSYFEIADPLSHVLRLIETGTLNVETAVPALYLDPTLAGLMEKIIIHWSIITGRDMRA